MNKRNSAPHRVVCKSLLVCDEDDKKKKKTTKASRPAVEVRKSLIDVSSTTSVPLTNGNIVRPSSSNEHEEPVREDKKSDATNRQKMLHQAASNLSQLRETPSNAVSSGDVPNSPPHEKERAGSRGVHSSLSIKSDGKDEKSQSAERINYTTKQTSSNDSLPVKPIVTKKYDKKETREYIRKKKLERLEKEQHEVVQRKMEQESRRQKLMELRDTQLKVLKASIKKKSAIHQDEDRNWRDVDDNEPLEAPHVALNFHSNKRTVNGYSKHNIELNNLNPHRTIFPTKSNHLLANNSLQTVQSKSRSNDIVNQPGYSNHERISPHFQTNEITKEMLSVPSASAITRKTQQNLQPISEVDNKKEFMRRLADEVNRLSSSIKFLKENASKTLLETDKISSKSTERFLPQDTGRGKPEISKSTQSVPQEMVSAVAELKDTLTMLSRTSLNPRAASSGSQYHVPVSMPLPRSVPVEEHLSGGHDSFHPNQIAAESRKDEKLQSVYQRHASRSKHHSVRTDEDKNYVSNEESDRSVSSGFIFESNSASVKDTDSEDLSAQWLKSISLQPNPMNFITTLKSKLHLNSQSDSNSEKEGKKLRMERMFETLNKKFKENLEKSLSSENDGTTHLKSSAIRTKSVRQSDMYLKEPAKTVSSENNQRQAEHFALENAQRNALETEDQMQEPTREPHFKDQRRIAKIRNPSPEGFINELRTAAIIDSAPQEHMLSAPKTKISSKTNLTKHKPTKEPKVNEPLKSSQNSDCVFIPLSIAHFPSADELRQSGTSTRSSSTQPPLNNEKPLIVPKLHLKSGLASSTDLSTFHSKSNSEVSTQSKDTIPVNHLKVPIQLRQITAADKSSLSSMSDLSESTIAVDNKENELPQLGNDLRKVYNPSFLRLQAEAELNQIDLYNDSMTQLVEAEHYRDLTLAKEATKEINGEPRSTSQSKSWKKARSVSTTPSLTEITDTSTIMSELLLMPNLELNRPSFDFKFSPDQAINKQSLQILEQLLKDEEFWANHQRESLKLREKALLNSIKVEIVWFEVQKKQLKDSGQEHLIKNLKKKQRGLLLKLKQEKEKIARSQKAISLASEERRQILLQQYQLVKAQISTKDVLKRKKADPLLGKNVNASKFILTKPVEPPIFKAATAGEIVCDKNLGQTLLEGLRALEQEKCKISEREKQLIEHSKNVDELLQWKKKFKDLEKQTGTRPLRDRSTSPFRMTPEPNNGATVPAGGDADLAHPTQSLKKSQEDTEGNQCGDLHNALLSSKGNLETNGIRSSDHYGSESVESPESSETPRAHQSLCNTEMSNAMKNMSAHTKQTSIHIKTPLSPRLQNSRRLRYSSGSDDSMIFSQNETLSEQSETEVRVSALHEQLKQRKLEAERLQREHKRAQKERLKMKEQALIKQIQAYDEYIQKTRRELEQELSQGITPVIRPQIKQPRVAEKTVFKRQDSVPPSNLSDTSDVTPRKAPSKEGQKVLEKAFEVEDSHNSELTEPEKNRDVNTEKFDKETKIPAEADQEPEICDSVISKSARIEPDRIPEELVPHLDLRSDGEEYLVEESPSKVEDALPEGSPVKTSQGFDQESEVVIEELLSSPDSKTTSEVPGLKTIASGEKPEVETEVSEALDSVSEVSGLPTPQESERLSSGVIDRVSSQNDAPIKDQVLDTAVVSPLAEIVHDDKISTISSVSSHLDGVPESEVSLPEKLQDKSEVESQKLDQDTKDVSSQQSEKSIPEICLHASQSESEELTLSEGTQPEELSQKTISEGIQPENTVAEPEFSDSILKAGEDWIDADDFFESNFPTTNKALKSSDFRVQSPESTGHEELKEASSGGDSRLDEVEPVPDFGIPQGSQKVFSSHESESEKSDNEDASSKCDSVASKTSVSSVKCSESGKSYEKDRSLSEVIENCEVSEVLDTSSTSNESYKTFDNDFEEAKDPNDPFSRTFIVNKEHCEPQRAASPCPSDVTDLITDAILSNLLQDSFDCIPPAKAEERVEQGSTSMLETPFIEALKRDHEALKVKSRGQSKEDGWEVAAENRDKLYSAISVAEMLLGTCLNDATETVLRIRKKVEDGEAKEAEEGDSTGVVQSLPGPEKDFSVSSSAKEAPVVVKTVPVKEQAGIGLGDDVDFNQDWLLDEECAAKEAEKLRLKQLQIEQEIERLQQAQQQTQQAPYIYERYLREIPNKPPPPYTPPVQPESVPTDENIVLNIVTSAAAHIYDSRLIHVEPKPPPSFTSDKNNSLAIYKKFLYDLCLQLINDIYTDDQNESAEPWEKTVKRRAKTKVPTNKAMLIEEIKQKVSILFGFRKKVAKENLIIRWSRKKRDHVDELLVREAQEEENEWTNYEFDEITVKNQVTVAILNSLINNTAVAFNKALQNKLQKLETLGR